MNTGYGNFPAVPVGDIAAGSNLPDVKALLNALQIVLEPVGHQDRLAVCAFDQVFQRVQFPLARLWRQGQRADTVVIHHIIAENTIDEQIMDALERKDTTQTALMNAVKAQLEV